MSSTPIKRQNHRIHPCNTDRKNELIQFLIGQYSGKNILIVTSNDTKELSTLLNGAIILNDAELAQKPDLRCDVLISYDLPEKAIIYMSRFARASEYALIVMDAEDQKRLYPIELLNGRTIIQEEIKGFEPDFGIAVENVQKAQVKAEKEARKEYFAIQDAKKKESRPKREGRPERKRDDAPRSDRRPPRKEEDGSSANAKPRYLGKDENGKPIFEGKTRERNHYFDGTPRTDEEKRSRTKFGSKPKFYGDAQKTSDGEKKGAKEKKPFGDKKPYGDKKPFGEKKPFDKDKKPFGEKKPYDKEGKKSFGDKKKPFGEKKSPRDHKPSDTPAAPKRPPRRIDVKSLKPEKKGE